MRTMHLIVKGRVQGVNFRYYTARKANLLGIKGFVKNLPNGDVEVKAQGSEEMLKELLIFCRKGPESAEVEEVIVQWVEEPELEGFGVDY